MIPQSDWDVLVIGAGPAGSRAAAAAALAGARTLLIDAKRSIGERPHCGEYVHEGLFERFDLEEASVIRKVDAIEAFVVSFGSYESRWRSSLSCLSASIPKSPEHEAECRPNDEPKLLWTYRLNAGGRMIDRSRFDRDLARRAASCGSTVISSARFVRRDGVGWVVRWKGRELALSSRWVVAADGALSAVASAVGQARMKLAVGIQVEVPLVRTTNEIRLFFSSDFFGGYGWLFPKGKTANVGVLVAQRKGVRPAGLLDKLVKWLAGMDVIRPGVLATHRGVIPVSGMRPTLVKDNVIFCGDAAGVAHPVTGAGIIQAVISGDLAGRAAARAAQTGILDHVLDYEVTMRSLYGSLGEDAAAQRESMISRWDDDGFEKLVKAAWFGHGVCEPAALTLSSYLGGVTDSCRD